MKFQESICRDMMGNPGYFIFNYLQGKGWLGSKSAESQKIGKQPKK